MATKIYRLYGIDTAMHLLASMSDYGKMYSWDEATITRIEV